MATVRQILVRWVSPNSPGGVSVVHFDSAALVSAQRIALGNALTAIEGELSGGVTWSIDQDGREYDEATGALTSVWFDPTDESGAGTNGVGPVPNASQALIRLLTTTVVNGRLVRGHFYIPGLSADAVSAGEMSTAALSTFNVAFGAFGVASSVGVWHRPVGGAGGQFIEADTVTTWRELAVLRRRR